MVFSLDGCSATDLHFLPAGWHTRAKTHADCGGVLEGSWTALCNNLVLFKRTSASPIQHTLTHILDATINSPEYCRQNGTVQVLDIIARLPATQLQHLVRCPTVYKDHPDII